MAGTPEIDPETLRLLGDIGDTLAAIALTTEDLTQDGLTTLYWDLQLLLRELRPEMQGPEN